MNLWLEMLIKWMVYRRNHESEQWYMFSFFDSLYRTGIKSIWRSVVSNFVKNTNFQKVQKYKNYPEHITKRVIGIFGADSSTALDVSIFTIFRSMLDPSWNVWANKGQNDVWIGLVILTRRDWPSLTFCTDFIWRKEIFGKYFCHWYLTEYSKYDPT